MFAPGKGKSHRRIKAEPRPPYLTEGRSYGEAVFYYYRKTAKSGDKYLEVKERMKSVYHTCTEAGLATQGVLGSAAGRVFDQPTNRPQAHEDIETEKHYPG